MQRLELLAVEVFEPLLLVCEKDELSSSLDEEEDDDEKEEERGAVAFE